MHRAHVVWLVLVILAVMAAWGLDRADALTAPMFRSIDTEQLHRMVVTNAYLLEGGRQRQFTVVDARTPAEYDQTHIFSAVNVPEQDFSQNSGQLPAEKEAQLVVYCGNGEDESCRRWALSATAMGYENILIYRDFSVWQAQHLPTAPLAATP